MEWKKERRLNEIRREKKKEERERKRRKLENSKSLSDYWGTISEHRTRRRRKGMDIKKEK